MTLSNQRSIVSVCLCKSFIYPSYMKQQGQRPVKIEESSTGQSIISGQISFDFHQPRSHLLAESSRAFPGIRRSLPANLLHLHIRARKTSKIHDNEPLTMKNINRFYKKIEFGFMNI